MKWIKVMYAVTAAAALLGLIAALLAPNPLAVMLWLGASAGFASAAIAFRVVLMDRSEGMTARELARRFRRGERYIVDEGK